MTSDQGRRTSSTLKEDLVICLKNSKEQRLKQLEGLWNLEGENVRNGQDGTNQKPEGFFQFIKEEFVKKPRDNHPSQRIEWLLSAKFSQGGQSKNGKSKSLAVVLGTF
ncbi:hypothetical protein Tco_0929409 [Tanacetum coccineum]